MTLARKAGPAFVDQALSSLTNVGLTLTAARSLSPRDFGAFSLGFSAYIVAVGISRHVCSDPLTIRYTSATDESRREAIARSTGSAIVVGLVVGIALTATSFFTEGPTRIAFLAFAPFLPLLLLQDAWRYAFFASGRGWHAAANDLVWGVTLGSGILALSTSPKTTLMEYALLWGGTGALAGLIGIVQASVRPRPTEVIRWWQKEGRLAARLMGEFITTTGTSQLSLYVVAALAGLSAVGGIRAAQVVLSPLSVLFMGVGLFALPEASRRARDPRTLIRFAIALSIALSLFALAWTIGLLFLPHSLGLALLAQNWEQARPLIVPLGIVMVATLGGSGGLLVLRALALAHKSFRIRLFLTVPVISSVAIGALISGAVGAAWGLAVVSTIGAIVWWLVAERNAGAAYGVTDHEPLLHPNGKKPRTL